MKGSIYQTKKGWGFRLDIGADPVSGKRVQRRFNGFRTKGLARQAMNKKIHELNEGTFVNPSNTTLGEFLKQWMEHKEKHVTKGTMDHYRPYINKHWLPQLGRIPLSKLKPVHIQQIYDDYVEEEILSNRSIVHMHRVLNNALKTALKWDMIVKNPCEGIKPPKPEKFEMSVWDEPDVQHFLNVAKEDRLYIVYLLALSTGMRKGEILGLRWSDIDFTNHMLSVRQAVRKKRGGGYEIGAVKTEHSDRTISLFEYVTDALKVHKRQQMAFKMEHRPTFKDHDLVVPAINGSFITPSNLDRRHWLPTMKKSMLKPIRFHDLRHTHATLMLKQGVHPKIVQERLGHSSIQVTLDTYSHVLPNLQKEAAQQFGANLFGSHESKTK